MTNSDKLVALRAGLTLIELLIVVGILTVLATISLNSVRGLLKNQKVSQATRLVQQYLEVAKVRAITTRRPVAVFFERTTLEGDGAGGFVPGNFTCNRISIGEVFPPYTGDVIGTRGRLWDVDFQFPSATVNARPQDGFADQIRLTPADVFSGFGIPGTGDNEGFVQEGDIIEIEGRQFVIEQIDEVVTNNITEFVVTFFNPPDPVAFNNFLDANNLTPTRGTLIPALSTNSPGLPINSGIALTGIGGQTQTTGFREAEFRIYRRPTKSLVGAITLPRGTCVDLSCSGLGVNGSAIDANTPFHLDLPPAVVLPGPPPTSVATVPSDYSRVALMFDASGRPSGMFTDTFLKNRPSPEPSRSAVDFNLNAKVFLLVGRTDQIAVDSGSVFVSRPDEVNTTTMMANIADTENSWITLNPLTGQIENAPVSFVPDADLANFVPFNGNNLAAHAASFRVIVGQSRALASVGVNNAGR